MQKLFVSAVFGMLFGIFCQNIFFTDIAKSVFFSLFLLIIIGECALFYPVFFRAFLLFFCCFQVGLVFTYFENLSVDQTQQSLHPYFLNSVHTIEMKVNNVYNTSEYDIDYIVDIKIVDDFIATNSIKAIMRLPRNFDLSQGDELQTQTKIYGILPYPKNIERYYLSKNIFFRIYPNDFQLLKKGDFSLIDNVRSRLLSKIYSLYPQDEAVFLSGILLGARESLPLELKNHFNASGLTHIIAVSGFNITILIIFVSLLFSIFPRYFQFAGAVFVVIFFVLLVGVSMPVLRAAIMGLLGYLLILTGRQANIFSLLLVSVLSIVVFSPLSLNYDISLQLSVLAVLGILGFYDMFDKFFQKYMLSIMSESLSITFAAMSLTLPLSMYYFGQISLVAPISNLLVVWNIPFIMLFGSLSLFLGYFSRISEYFSAYISYIFLHFDLQIVHFFGKQKWSVISTPLEDIGIYFLCLYFVFFAFMFYRNGVQTQER